MEHAAYVTRLDGLDKVEARHTRLYFGAEFCQLCLPSREKLARVLAFADERAMPLTLVTPFVTDWGMDLLVPLLRQLAEARPGAEVVANDWGVLRRTLEVGGLEPVLGRLLNRQRRDPMVTEVLARVPEATVDHFRTGAAGNQAIRGYLGGLGVRRVELDNLLHGLTPTEELRASLYYPYGYISTTRRCLVSGCDSDTYDPRQIPTRCDRACERYVFRLERGFTPATLHLGGNTHFFENHELPEDPAALGIDRLVEEVDLLTVRPPVLKSGADAGMGPRSGVPAGTLVPKGYGKTRPVADNETLDGRAENRRVVFEILELDGKPAPDGKSVETPEEEVE